MTLGTDVPMQTGSQPKYARFSRRLQAVLIDTILISLTLVGVLLVAVALESSNIGRLLGFSLVAALLLYEPLMVSLSGGTVGHLLRNLRVVDNRSRRNVSFPKAVARTVIKSLLGLYSFVSMALTRRYQAVHDLFTNSSVQIRDAARARPYHYYREQPDIAKPGMPSVARRIVVIGVYLLFGFAVYALVLLGLMSTGLLSEACFFDDRCSAGDSTLQWLSGLAWLGVSVSCIIRGWRGRLPGGRVRSQK